MLEPVPANDDVGRRELIDRRIGAPEEDVLAGGFEVVVLNRVVARPVPAADGLRVLASRFDVRDVGIGNRRPRRVERDAPLLSDVWITVDLDAIDDEIGGDLSY